MNSKKLFSTQPSPEDIDELIVLYNQGRFEQVLSKVKSLSELHQRTIMLLNLEGASNAAIKRYDAAIECYQRALKIDPNNVEIFYSMGNAWKSQGDLDAAIECYQRALIIKPNYVEAHYNLGNALRLNGKLASALDSYKRAIKIKPDFAAAYYNMGVALKEKGELEPSIYSYHQAIKLKPNFAEAHHNMGNALKDKGDLDAAIKSYKQAIKIKSDYAETHNNMGVALKDKGRLSEAIESYHRAIKIKPDYADAYSNLAIALAYKGELDAAVDSFKQVVKIEPLDYKAYYNMGNALKDKGDLDAAIKSYKQAIKIKSDYAETHNNMGVALKDKGKLGEAIDSYERAIKIKPDYAEAYSNMGIALSDKGDLAAAINSYEQAIKIDYDNAKAHQNLGFSLLKNGQLVEGLCEYEWRWKNTSNFSKERHFIKPFWDGTTSLKDKTILLWDEQGPGDMIVWSSCLKNLSANAGHCILECSEKLLPLFSRSFPSIEVKIANDSSDSQRDDFDYHLPMGSLFRCFIDEISASKVSKSYLFPNLDRVDFWKKRLDSLGPRPHIGISWKSPVMTPARQPNYTEISDWAPLFSLPDITFVNLQSTDFVNDLKEIYDKFGITVHNFDDLDHYDDLDDVAALSAALDVVVSVATAVPTLTSAIGTPTKLITWRQSPWNNILFKPVGPTLDVFERNTWESWSDVFHSIADDIMNN